MNHKFTKQTDASAGASIFCSLFYFTAPIPPGNEPPRPLHYARPYYCAAVMVDADGLKMVNDTYGHENGDEYLKKIAEMLKQEAGENCILCRQGGDEFTLFYYKYEKEALIQKIEALKALQSGQKAWLRDGLTVDLRFSMGSSMAYGAVDYDKMYREADEKMYEDKRMRKKCECS